MCRQLRTRLHEASVTDLVQQAGRSPAAGASDKADSFLPKPANLIPR